MTSTLLIVDDNEGLAEALQDGLVAGTPGYEVLTALGVDAAVAILAEHAVDLVITDVQMPGKTGFDLLAYMIEHHPGLPSIVMTGFGTPDMERRAGELGSLRVLAKPLEIADLRNEVESVLAGAAAGALLDFVSQAGFLQLLSLERSTCRVTLAWGTATAEIAFVNGALCQAKAGELTGQDAVFELLSWKAPEISVRPLRRKPSQPEKLDLQTLLLEAARREDERIRDNPPSAAEGAEPKPATRKKSPKRPSALRAERVQETKEEQMALETYLEDLKGINGYLASGVMNFTGEMLASHSSSKDIDLDLVGATFNDIFRSAHEASNKIGLSACRETVISTPKGIVLMRCTGADKDPHIHMVVVMKADGNKALMDMQLAKLNDKVVEELS